MKKSAYTILLKYKQGNILLEHIFELLENKYEMNIDEIAKNTFMSKSSVSRYFKQLGFSGFSEFKILLLNEVNEHFCISSIEKFENEMIITPIKNTNSLNSKEKFEDMYNVVINSGTNYLLGAGGNASACYELKTRLNRFGFLAEMNTDLHSLYSSISNARPGDVLWVISYTGETKEVTKIVQKAHERKIIIITITGNSNNTIFKFGNVNFLLDNSESTLRTLSIKSRMSTFFLISKIALFIYLKDKIKYDKLLINSLYK